jgi:hypothetical protein
LRDEEILWRFSATSRGIQVKLNVSVGEIQSWVLAGEEGIFQNFTRKCQWRGLCYHPATNLTPEKERKLLLHVASHKPVFQMEKDVNYGGEKPAAEVCSAAGAISFICAWLSLRD